MLRSTQSTVTLETSPDVVSRLTRDTLHVHRNMQGGWQVRRHGSVRSLRNFKERADAIRLARQLARKWKGDLAVHGRDGMVETFVSYGPHPKWSKKKSTR